VDPGQTLGQPGQAGVAPLRGRAADTGLLESGGIGGQWQLYAVTGPKRAGLTCGRTAFTQGI